MYEATGKFAAVTKNHMRCDTYRQPEQGAITQTVKLDALLRNSEIPAAIKLDVGCLSFPPLLKITQFPHPNITHIRPSKTSLHSSSYISSPKNSSQVALQGLINEQQQHGVHNTSLRIKKGWTMLIIADARKI